MALTAKIINNLDNLVALTGAWEDLLTRSVTQTPFQTPAFVLSWLKTFDQKVKIQAIVIHNSTNQLVGLAPLCLTSDNKVEFIGGKNVSDYLDFMIDRSYQVEVYQQISQVLFSWQVAKTNLYSLPASSPTLHTLPKLWAKLTGDINYVSQKIQDVCPVITLPDSWEKYLAQIERKQRHEIRRKWRKLESLAEVEFVTVTKPQDLDWAVTEFIRLHKLSSKDKARFWIPGMAEFFYEFMLALAHKNQLRLTFLKIKDINLEAELDFPKNPLVATMLGFIANGQYLLYNSGFDPEYALLSAGQVLTAYTIKTAIAEKLTHYDFMRGREEYKFRLGGQSTEVFDLTLIT